MKYRLIYPNSGQLQAIGQELTIIEMERDWYHDKDPHDDLREIIDTGIQYAWLEFWDTRMDEPCWKVLGSISKLR